MILDVIIIWNKYGPLICAFLAIAIVLSAFLFFIKKKKVENNANNNSGENNTFENCEEFIELGSGESVLEVKSDDTLSADSIKQKEFVTTLDEKKDYYNIYYSENKIFVRFNKSFIAKLVQVNDKSKLYYVELHNYLKCFNKINSRISWNYELFIKGRKQVAKLSIKGKHVYLYLALNPEKYIDTKYSFKDEGDKAKYKNVPFRVKLTSDLSLTKSKELIDILMKEIGSEKNELKEEVSINLYPFESTEKLIEKGLIKEIALNSNENATEKVVITDPFAKISAEEVNNYLSDDQVEDYEEISLEYFTKQGVKAIINIDTISNNFNPNDIVTIESLQEKNLISRKAGKLKVLARGVLDKPLNIVADEFSIVAKKMVVLTGGKIIMRKKDPKS